MRFHLTILRPEGLASFCVRAFHEVVETLAYGLQALGHESSFKSNHIVKDAQNIVLGAQFAAASIDLPAGTILYNLEQMGANPAQTQWLDALAKRFRVWDYSPFNIAYWRKQGVEADYVPIGYMPQLTRIPPVIYPNIDVLFYGSLNERRAKVIRDLQATPGLKTQVVLGFGKERDHMIARSKVILNVHYYEAPQLFEQVRVSYLLSNRKCVVAESAEDFPSFLQDALKVVSYSDLAEACRELVKDPKTRALYQERGLATFSKLRESQVLRVALAHLSEPAPNQDAPKCAHPEKFSTTELNSLR